MLWCGQWCELCGAVSGCCELSGAVKAMGYELGATGGCHLIITLLPSGQWRIQELTNGGGAPIFEKNYKLHSQSCMLNMAVFFFLGP